MLNLIADAWIPVRMADGACRKIAPWQIAEPGIAFPDWPRPDLNVACLEMLIGLVYMADPPENIEDWDRRVGANPDRLREKLAPYAPAFNLLGEGPLFLQDFEPLSGEQNPVDMLFIDSAGGNTIRNNADLMVHRGRYGSLDPALAAMTLYTFQAFAPAGGAGNRTSMRGGGPLVTLVDPEADLWALVWANVPEGRPAEMRDLPWMRATKLSDNGTFTYPPDDQSFGVEAFFGQPRRLRLIAEKGVVTGVIQKPSGTNYAGWRHPLSPYYRLKLGSELLPKHPRAGRFGLRNWLGVTMGAKDDGLAEVALCLKAWKSRGGGAGSVLVAGWGMDNMKARDFTFSRQPIVDLEVEAEDRLKGLILAADQAGILLRAALAPVLAEGDAREEQREAFFIAIETDFLTALSQLASGADPEKDWLKTLRKQAFQQFDAFALPGLDQRVSDQVQKIVDARKYLGLGFSGYGTQGKVLFQELGFEVPVSKKGKAA